MLSNYGADLQIDIHDDGSVTLCTRRPWKLPRRIKLTADEAEELHAAMGMWYAGIGNPNISPLTDKSFSGLTPAGEKLFGRRKEDN